MNVWTPVQRTEDELLNLRIEIQRKRIETKLRFGYEYDTTIEKLPNRIYEMPTAHGLLSEI